MPHIIAGHKGFRFEADSVLDESDLPEHVQVTTEPDFEAYAEGDLTDAELLAVAASDALDAAAAGELLGEAEFAEVDELSLRRVLRTAHRQAEVALEVIA